MNGTSRRTLYSYRCSDSPESINQRLSPLICDASSTSRSSGPRQQRFWNEPGSLPPLSAAATNRAILLKRDAARTANGRQVGKIQ